MMSKCSKERATGSLAGYFDTEFKILRGTYVDPISMRRQARIEAKKKNIVNKPFVSMYRPKDPYEKTRAFLPKNCAYKYFLVKVKVHSLERSVEVLKILILVNRNIVNKRNHRKKNQISKSVQRKKEPVMGMFPSTDFSFSLAHLSLYSYPNMGIGLDPPYAYKDKTDNYEAVLNAQRV